MYLSGTSDPALIGEGGIVTVFQNIDPDSLGYNILIKKTSQTITATEIAGTYLVRFLETGPGGIPYTCGQGTCLIDSNGMMHVDAWYSNDEHDVFDANYTLGAGNKFSIEGNPEEGIISPDLGLIFIPEYICSNPRNYYQLAYFPYHPI